MNKIEINNKGFTLIEIIVSLVLVGMIGAIAGIGMVNIVEGFFFAKTNTEVSQKAQIAITRITKEFSSIIQIPGHSSSTSLTYSKNPLNPADIKTLAFNNVDNKIYIDTDVLIDNASSFTLEYYNYYNDPTPSNTYLSSTVMIKVTLQITGASGVISTFTTCIFLNRLMG
ncbi:MAG: type II secretion system protein [Desulfobacterales bacterium]|nr:type II secretion system protein [Desulfobacterales bacterium]